MKASSVEAPRPGQVPGASVGYAAASTPRPATVSKRLKEYRNDAWIAALKDAGPGDRAMHRAMIEELSDYLRRVLGKTLAHRGLGQDDLADLTQEAMLQLVSCLHTFRGDSAFSTWAAAVATRIAFTELRRRAARETKHEHFRQARADAVAQGHEPEAPEEDGRITTEFVLSSLHRAIKSDLTERQRIATLALLRGVPTIEIAEQLGSNQNAVYKLVHDARLRLKDALVKRGVSESSIDDMAKGGARS